MLARVESAAVAVVASSRGKQREPGGAALLRYAYDSRSSSLSSCVMDMSATLCSRAATRCSNISAWFA